MTVTLTGTDVNDNALTLTTQTAADGSYSFTGLFAGNYTLTETPPPSVAVAGANGFFQGEDAVGSLGGTAPTGNQLTVQLGPPRTAPTTTSAPGRRPIRSASSHVDTNRNGQRDPGEHGIAGVAVTVWGTAFAGTPLGEVTADGRRRARWTDDVDRRQRPLLLPAHAAGDVPPRGDAAEELP